MSEIATPPRRGRPPGVKNAPKPPEPPMPPVHMDEDMLLAAATEAVLAGEPSQEVSKRLALKPSQMQVVEEETARAKTLQRRVKRTPQELLLSRELDGETLNHALFLAVQGKGFKQINSALAAKKLKRMTPTQYGILTNLPQVLAANEALMLIGLEKGVGRKLKRIQMLSDLAVAAAERAIAELQKPKPDTALLKVLMPETREYTKEISIETGERVENFNIDAFIRQATPQQLLQLAELSDDDIIEGDISHIVDVELEEEAEGTEQDDDAE